MDRGMHDGVVGVVFLNFRLPIDEGVSRVRKLEGNVVSLRTGALRLARLESDNRYIRLNSMCPKHGANARITIELIKDEERERDDGVLDNKRIIVITWSTTSEETKGTLCEQ